MEEIPTLSKSLVKNEVRLLYACIGLVSQSAHVIETSPQTLSQFGNYHRATSLCGQVRNFDPAEGRQDLVREQHYAPHAAESPGHRTSGRYHPPSRPLPQSSPHPTTIHPPSPS